MMIYYFIKNKRLTFFITIQINYKNKFRKIFNIPLKLTVGRNDYDKKTSRIKFKKN